MLVVATYRDVVADTRAAAVDALADLWRLESVVRLPLGRLSAEDIASLVRESTSAEASPELVAAFVELTDGTPLLVCELWRELLATNGVQVSDDVHLVAAIDDVRGPERIRDAVRQRLGRLEPERKAIVELASVAGPTFEVQVLTEAAGANVHAALD